MKITQLFLVVFSFALLLCIGGLVFIITEINQARKTLTTKQNELTAANKAYKDVEERLTQISNLVGFRVSNSNQIASSNVDDIIYFLDLVCSKEYGMQGSSENKLASHPYNKDSLHLNFGRSFAGQTIDVGNQIAKTGSADKTCLSQISFVKNMVTLEDVYNAANQQIEDLQKQVKILESTLAREQKDYDNLLAETQESVNTAYNNIQSKHTELNELATAKKDELQTLEQDRAKAHNEALEQKKLLAAATLDKQKTDNKQNDEQKELDERINELQTETTDQTSIQYVLKSVDDSLAKVQTRKHIDDVLAQTTQHGMPTPPVEATTSETTPPPTSPEGTPPTTASTHLTQQQKEQAEQLNPDGEILFCNQKSQVAYINLGRTDGISKGMTFDVKTYTKGGQTLEKGKVIVREVHANMSLVGIEELKNSLNPIQARDKIFNKVYDRNKIKYFAIAGHLSQKYSSDQVRRLVVQIGGQIEDNLSAKTDIVILGEGYTEDPIYKLVQERGMATMLEVEFLSYLGSIE